jgi:thymidylate synthase
MRIFQNAMEMVKEVERDLFEMGIRYQSDTVQDRNVSKDPGFRTIEISGYAYALTGFSGLDEMVKYLGNNLFWAEEEAKERLYPSVCDPNPGMAYLNDLTKWKKFLRDGMFSYSYAERERYQIPYVIRELLARPNSRQAMITVYDVHQDMMNWGGRDRVPCSVSYQFIVRDEAMTLIYTQRSCDFLAFFSTDVYLAVRLLFHVAEQVNAKPMRLIHFIGSLHSFAKDLEGRGIF